MLLEQRCVRDFSEDRNCVSSKKAVTLKQELIAAKGANEEIQGNKRLNKASKSKGNGGGLSKFPNSAAVTYCQKEHPWQQIGMTKAHIPSLIPFSLATAERITYAQHG
jgi:hypothetical protein